MIYWESKGFCSACAGGISEKFPYDAKCGIFSQFCGVQSWILTRLPKKRKWLPFYSTLGEFFIFIPRSVGKITFRPWDQTLVDGQKNSYAQTCCKSFYCNFEQVLGEFLILPKFSPLPPLAPNSNIETENNRKNVKHIETEKKNFQGQRADCERLFPRVCFVCSAVCDND